MQVTETLSDGLRRAFSVTVPVSDIESKRGTRLAEIGKTLKLPGFRPGKIPANLLRQRYGDAVQAEIVQDLIESTTNEVMSDRGLRPAARPKIDVVSAEAGQDLQFTIEMEVLPEIALPDFGAISLTRLKAEPAEDEIQKTLGELASRQKEMIDVAEPRGAEKGETLVVDFVGSIDGTPFPGGSAEDVSLEVAGSGFIPGFTEQVEGMHPGEARDIEVTFPAEYPAKELAGKSAKFAITAKKLQIAKPAEIDEALASKLGFDSLDKLRDAVTGQMQREYDDLSRLRVKRELLDALAGMVRFDPPTGMVQGEFDAIWRRVEADMKAGKLDADDQDKSEETLQGEYRAIAERRVRLGLLLAEIGRVNGIQVAQDEMTRAMRAEAARYPGQERQVIDYFSKNPRAAESLRGPIFEDKVVDFILDAAKVADRPATAEELVAEPEHKAA